MFISRHFPAGKIPLGSSNSNEDMDFNGSSNVKLKFARWLNTDIGVYNGTTYIDSRIEVSNNGSTWIPVWYNESPTPVGLFDSSWQILQYDISAVANDEATVYVRWSHRVLDGLIRAHSGWNIDDVMIGDLP